MNCSICNSRGFAMVFSAELALDFSIQSSKPLGNLHLYWTVFVVLLVRTRKTSVTWRIAPFAFMAPATLLPVLGGMIELESDDVLGTFLLFLRGRPRLRLGGFVGA
jgi:hypothetical protein